MIKFKQKQETGNTNDDHDNIAARYAKSKWFDIPTGTSADLDMRYLIAIRPKSDKNTITKSLLIDESTNQAIENTEDLITPRNNNNNSGNINTTTKPHTSVNDIATTLLTEQGELAPNNSSKDKDKSEMSKQKLLNQLKKNEVVFVANKGRWKLFSFGLLVHLVLAGAIQYKNYHEEQQKLFEWGYRFSRLLDIDELAVAKYEKQQGIKPDPNEQYDDLDFLEHWARMSHNSH